MASRILVADDSLTIQKVIGITLANSGYELVECVNEEDLFKKIQSSHFDLILLDFNLSDSKSGYDLSKQINANIPSAAIIVMLGTFDSIDESQFAGCGILDKIVKPFESSKFIKKCRDVLEGARPAVSLQEAKSNKTDSIATVDSSDLDLWTVDAPKMNKAPEVNNEYNEPLFEAADTKSLDPLASEIEGWGFRPSNYLEEKFQKTFPPVIEETNEGSVIEKFQGVAEFQLEEDTHDNDETDPSFEMPEDLNRNLLTEINEEISAEAFWAVDEVVPVKAEEYKDIQATNLEEVTTDLTETVQNFKEQERREAEEATALQLAQSTSKAKNTKKEETVIHMDQDELVEKLKISLRPMIEEMVKEFCRQNVEKVAWEVIPDLAENLIRKEIKEISDSVQH
ncbi:MAG: response regulator [Bdellovibrionales bacterium]|nr:response regulator [Bdellovibrionales bacterium]